MDVATLTTHQSMTATLESRPSSIAGTPRATLKRMTRPGRQERTYAHNLHLLPHSHNDAAPRHVFLIAIRSITSEIVASWSVLRHKLLFALGNQPTRRRNNSYQLNWMSSDEVVGGMYVCMYVESERDGERSTLVK
jgi:hypothetical protein